MRLDPLADRVIFEEIQESKLSKGGLLIPDAARKNKAISYGKVVAAGPGRMNAEGKLVPLSVKEGDCIMFPRQAPAVLPLVDDHGAEKDFLMCREQEIIGIVHGLEKATAILGLDGARLSLEDARIAAIEPQSLARPDVAYKNEAEIDEAVSDLRQSGAPPEVIAEIDGEHQDEE
jgi:chaperonin GroES